VQRGNNVDDLLPGDLKEMKKKIDKKEKEYNLLGIGTPTVPTEVKNAENMNMVG
jgi:hypothetical protein